MKRRKQKSRLTKKRFRWKVNMKKFLVTVAEFIDREKYFKRIADYEKTKQILKEFSDHLQQSADALKKIIDSLTTMTDSLSNIKKLNEYGTQH